MHHSQTMSVHVVCEHSRETPRIGHLSSQLLSRRKQIKVLATHVMLTAGPQRDMAYAVADPKLSTQARDGNIGI
jgi:hypothetical protein